jgi:hypothetical protein
LNHEQCLSRLKKTSNRDNHREQNPSLALDSK